jgi:hypothetical protein
MEQGLHQVPPTDPIPLVQTSNSLQPHETMHTYDERGPHQVPPNDHVPPVCASDSPLRREIVHTHTEQGPHQVPPTDTVSLLRASDSPQPHETMHKHAEKGLRLQVPPAHPVPRNENEQDIHQAPDETPLTPAPFPARASDGPSRHVQEIPQANVQEFGAPPE